MDLIGFQERIARRNARRRERYASGEDGRKAYNQRWKDAHRDEVRKAERLRMRALRATEEGRERTSAAVQRYKQRNPEKVKRWQREWWEAHPNYNRAQLMQRAKAQPEKYLFWQAKRRAKLRGVEFTLALEDIVIPRVCPVLGIPIAIGSGQRGRANGSPSLDRFDNAKGYVPGNVRVISMRANWLKSNGTLAEFESIVRYMRDGQ